jgi:hypothetical protein
MEKFGLENGMAMKLGVGKAPTMLKTAWTENMRVWDDPKMLGYGASQSRDSATLESLKRSPAGRSGKQCALR